MLKGKGNFIEHKNKVMASFRLNKFTLDYIKSATKESDISQSEFLELVIESYKNSSNIKIDNAETSFLMTTKATNEEIYDYLKCNPNASRFIFKKYKENQDFIKELCDPENPLYLDDVANNLLELYQVSENKENLDQIKSEIQKYSLDLDRLKDEIKENERAFDQIESELRTKKKEKEELDRLSANIRSDPGLEKIEAYISQTKTIMETIMKKGDQYQKEHPFLPDITIDLTKDQIMNIKGIIKGADELKTYIESNDFISNEYLDENRRKIKEIIEKEKEQTKKQVDLIKEMNPLNRIKKISEGINLVVNQLDQGDDVGGIITFRKTGIGIIKGNLMDVQRHVENMEIQFRNIKNGEKSHKLFGGLIHASQ
ncbi:hypothetical protein [Caldiplasma sukawensis]